MAAEQREAWICLSTELLEDKTYPESFMNKFLEELELKKWNKGDDPQYETARAIMGSLLEKEKENPNLLIEDEDEEVAVPAVPPSRVGEKMHFVVMGPDGEEYWEENEVYQDGEELKYRPTGNLTKVKKVVTREFRGEYQYHFRP